MIMSGLRRSYAVKILTVLALLPLTAYADMITPSHNCSKPNTPSQFSTDAERRAFDRQVRTYKQCLSDFVKEQEKEARMHSEAASSANNELKQIGS
jgi:hypothetical protein